MATLSVPAEALSEYKAELTNAIHLKIEKISDFYTGNDLILRAIGELPEKLKKKLKKN